MRIVLDTNIIVSALMTPNGDPARILDLVIAGRATLLLDERILDEYREVLRRKKFGFDFELVDDLIALLDRFGEYVSSEPSGLKTQPDNE